MNTISHESGAPETKLLSKHGVYEVVGCAIGVLNSIRPGLKYGNSSSDFLLVFIYVHSTG